MISKCAFFTLTLMIVSTLSQVTNAYTIFQTGTGEVIILGTGHGENIIVRSGTWNGYDLQFMVFENSARTDFFFSGVTGIYCDLGSASFPSLDSLTIEGVVINGAVELVGTNNFTTGSGYSGRRLFVRDSLIIGDLVFKGTTGQDIVVLDGCNTIGDVDVHTGSETISGNGYLGIDMVDILNCRISGNTSVITKLGLSRVEFRNSGFYADFVYKGGSSRDEVVVSDCFFGLTPGSASQLRLLEGDDILSISSTTFSGSCTVTGDAGFDTGSATGVTYGQAPVISGFEKGNL